MADAGQGDPEPLVTLFLAYHFPPVGGAGVQRSAKFVRHLAAEGVRPVVITGPGQVEGRWTPRDESLQDDVPEGTRVVRIAAAEPPPVGRARALAERWVLWPSRFDRWWVRGCVAEGLRATAAHRPRILYASMQPYSQAAAQLSRRTGLPWVADLRDPWALDEILVYQSRWHRRFEVRRMYRVLRSAAAIVMNTREAQRALLEAFPELGDRPVSVITNGFDAGDFTGSLSPRTDGTFRIVHTGSLHTEIGQHQLRREGGALRRQLGGSISGVHLLSRSHAYLLQAIERWLALEPGIAARARLVLAGVISREDRALVERSTARALVEMPGYQPHADSVAWVRAADLLFLPMHALADGARARIVPGKTYEYLAAGRPILAAVPEGDARDLLARSGRAHLCAPTDSAAMLEILRARYDEFRRDGHRRLQPLDPLMAGFERQELTRQLARVLREAAAAPPGSASGAAAPPKR